MSSFNKVILMGNLTRDPELRFIPSGQGVATFTLAMNRNYLGKNDEKKEEVTFIRCVVWGKRAEVINEYVKKGNPLHVEGRLMTRSWEAQDGSKRSATEVIVESFQFISSSKPKPEATTNSAPAPEPETDLKPDDEVPF